MGLGVTFSHGLAIESTLEYSQYGIRGDLQPWPSNQYSRVSPVVSRLVNQAHGRRATSLYNLHYNPPLTTTTLTYSSASCYKTSPPHRQPSPTDQGCIPIYGIRGAHLPSSRPSNTVSVYDTHMIVELSPDASPPTLKYNANLPTIASPRT
jgi:hypothetical protein